MAEKGLLVFVLRCALPDATNGGVSSEFDQFVALDGGMPEVFTPSDTSPALYLREFYGQIIALPEPIDTKNFNLGGYMFGGNFIYTSDSRFAKHPIMIFDRLES